MATSQTKPSSKAEFNTFVQGLITEASPLNFPVNASVQETNFDLNRDGTRDRRRGMDYEDDFVELAITSPVIPTSDFSTTGFSTFNWESPGGFVDQEILAVQLGNRIRFFDLTKEALSLEGEMGTVVITEFPATKRFSFGVVNGKLVIAAGEYYLATFNYLGGTGDSQFPLTYRTLQVRDVWGLEPESPANTQPDARMPVSPTPFKHLYNLRNQGWAVARQGEVKWAGVSPPITTENPGFIDPLYYFQDRLGAYPADNESVYTGLQFQAAIANIVNRPSEQMILALYGESRNTTPLPARGYFVIDLLKRGQGRSDAQTNQYSNPYLPFNTVSSFPSDITPGGASCVRGFSGRMFFAGFNGQVVGGDSRSPSLESFVAFSQLVKKNEDLTKCYQEGDPTSREASDVVDTDGGFIRISGAAKIIGMRQLGASLIVFASNGVWEVNGGSDFGFSATNYKVTKLSSVGCYSDTSIVEEVGKLYFWSLDGIYAVGADQFQVNAVLNITERTIQTAYANIPTTAKEKSVGVYDPFAKKIKWIFNDGTEFSSESSMKELTFDTVLNAFTINTIGNVGNAVENISAFTTPPFRTGDNIEDIVVGEDPVLVVADQVVITVVERMSGLQSIKYLTLIDNGGFLAFTFSLYNNTDFIDWERVDTVGVDAKAFLLTGSQIAGDSSVHKQIPYLTIHFRRTESGYDVNGDPDNPSGCLVRSQWDFANTINSHKWSSLFQAYRYNNSFLITNPTYDSGFELITTKNKLRGRGKAFSLYLESEPRKDLRIVGWNLAVNGNGIT